MPKPVVVVGDAIVDHNTACRVERIAAEAPVPVITTEPSPVTDRPEWTLGGAANVAANIAAMGREVSLVYAADNKHTSSAELLLLLLSRAGVRAVPCYGGNQVTTKHRFIEGRSGQIVARVDEDMTRGPEASDMIRIAESIGAGRNGPVVVADYGKGAVSPELYRELSRTAHANANMILVDPKHGHYDWYRGADVVKPNLSEFGYPVANDDEEVRQACQRLAKGFDFLSVVCTRGAGGATYYGGGKVAHYPWTSNFVADVTGAGDTFIAGLAAAIADGGNYDEAMNYAMAASAVAVQRRGTAVISEDMVRAIIVGIRPSEKILPRNSAASTIRHAAKGAVVFTNGCFDLLHDGHRHLLAEAAKLGKHLVVGINSDESVQRLKGLGRPVQTLARRMQAVAALPHVAYVVGFDADTPDELIEAICPDVLVKGDEYRESVVPGADFVARHGGEVRFIPQLRDVSTTKIIEGR